MMSEFNTLAVIFGTPSVHFIDEKRHLVSSQGQIRIGQIRIGKDRKGKEGRGQKMSGDT